MILIHAILPVSKYGKLLQNSIQVHQGLLRRWAFCRFLKFPAKKPLGLVLMVNKLLLDWR